MRRRRALLVLVLVLAACSRRDVDVERERPRALPTHELADAAIESTACDGGLCAGACVDLARDPGHCGACDRSCDAGACLVGQCVKPIVWADSARVMLSGAACDLGARMAARCPSTTAPPAGPVWGTDLYTTDSSICVAARHAGLVTPAGGDVAIEIFPGAPSYRGSTRNGVTTSAWAAYECSFRFVTTMGCEPPATACTGRCADLMTDHDDCGACGTRCGPDDSCHKGRCEPGIDATWTTTAADRACIFTAVPIYTYVCPPGGAAATVWGTDVYTHDSSICTAAVHAGKITMATGGTVTLAMHAGMPSYKGTLRNGVTTTSYGAWTCSYEFR